MLSSQSSFVDKKIYILQKCSENTSTLSPTIISLNVSSVLNRVAYIESKKSENYS